MQKVIWLLPEVVHTAGEYRGKYPFEIGPTFVHTNREANNYVNFFEVLKKLNSEFKDIQAFGSDGDIALLNAVAICYPSPLHLTCSDHKKSNIERKLGEYKATKAATKHVLSDIFGRKLGSVSPRNSSPCVVGLPAIRTAEVPVYGFSPPISAPQNLSRAFCRP
jgi:hypothetical protein